MQNESIKAHLIQKLKDNHCFWSYDESSIQDVPNDVLIENVMLYLDIDDINLLFKCYSYNAVKKAWIENVVAQGERFYQLNAFFAWYYFSAKRPKGYVKAMVTRMLHKRIAS